ncbi:MAG: isoprenylcysteine carboxylmethyltransferase family protein [Vicinamibacterales bacterium]
MTATGRGPGVRFPPPLLFVGGFGLGVLLNRRLEFLVTGSGAGPIQTTVGLAALALGLTLMAWGIVTFLRARTAVMPTRPARDLVRSGPYRFSRNPMYVGLTTAYLGGVLVTNLAWPLMLLPFVLLLLVLAVIRREERYLHGEFGDAYAAYCRDVRRWL